MLLIDGTFSFATPFCACIFNKHSNALHFILEPGQSVCDDLKQFILKAKEQYSSGRIDLKQEPHP
jgi:hypothetical protein